MTASGVAALRDWVESGVPEAVLASDLGLVVIAPVTAQERLVGMVGLGGRVDGEPYGSIDLEYLEAAAGMVGGALENARLYHRARESNRRLRETNERLAELDRLKSEFLGNVNHELRTPLAVTRGYLDMLESMLTEPQARDAVAMATRHALKLEGLLENLLDFSRLEDDALKLKLEPHDVGDLLSGFAEERRSGIAEGLRELDLDVAPGLPPVICDPRRLVQIVDELVSNAVKFTSPGSRIRVSARGRSDEIGECVAIEIQDDGPGIAADRLETLFEPFRQGNGSTTREAGGMGLGLALARRLAEAMGGGLEARSEPGVGSCFVVTLMVA
jgi:signal transduction histidine kinase